MQRKFLHEENTRRLRRNLQLNVLSRRVRESSSRPKRSWRIYRSAGVPVRLRAGQRETRRIALLWIRSRPPLAKGTQLDLPRRSSRKRKSCHPGCPGRALPACTRCPVCDRIAGTVASAKTKIEKLYVIG